MTRLLVDAETYLYTSAAGAEYEVQLEHDLWHYWVDAGQARSDFIDRIESLTKQAQADHVLLCWGHRENFRYAIDRTYKGNRRRLRRPAGYRDLVRWAMERWPSAQLRGCEGDDVVGISRRWCMDLDVIASVDKDLRTLQGRHLIDGEVVEIGHREAWMAFYSQVLSGDSADGYPGCPGLGPVKARRMLEDAIDDEHGWWLVCRAYTDAGLTEDDAIRTARLARILDMRLYDHEKNVPLLWQPPVALPKMPAPLDSPPT